MALVVGYSFNFHCSIHNTNFNHSIYLLESQWLLFASLSFSQSSSGTASPSQLWGEKEKEGEKSETHALLSGQERWVGTEEALHSLTATLVATAQVMQCPRRRSEGVTMT